MYNTENSFNFFVPIELEKGKTKKGEKVMKIKGIASTPEEDSEGEVLLPVGFDLSRFLSTGFLNWNHQGKNDASKIIGEPTVAKVTSKGDLYVEGVLYNGHPLAESVWALAETLETNGSDRRIGFSIEGRATERDPMNPKRITKALLTGLAITPTPVNMNTYVELVKGVQKNDFVEYEEEDILAKSSDYEYLYEFTVSDKKFAINKAFELVDIEKAIHKYIRKEGNKYIYDEKEGKKHLSNLEKELLPQIKEKFEKMPIEELKRLQDVYKKDEEKYGIHKKPLLSHEREILLDGIIKEREQKEKSMDVAATRPLIPESLDKKPKVLEPTIKKAFLMGLIPIEKMQEIMKATVAQMGEIREYGGVKYIKVANVPNSKKNWVKYDPAKHGNKSARPEVKHTTDSAEPLLYNAILELDDFYSEEETHNPKLGKFMEKKEQMLIDKIGSVVKENKISSETFYKVTKKFGGLDLFYGDYAPKEEPSRPAVQSADPFTSFVNKVKTAVIDNADNSPWKIPAADVNEGTNIFAANHGLSVKDLAPLVGSGAMSIGQENTSKGSFTVIKFNKNHLKNFTPQDPAKKAEAEAYATKVKNVQRNYESLKLDVEKFAKDNGMKGGFGGAYYIDDPVGDKELVNSIYIKPDYKISGDKAEAFILASFGGGAILNFNDVNKKLQDTRFKTPQDAFNTVKLIASSLKSFSENMAKIVNNYEPAVKLESGGIVRT